MNEEITNAVQALTTRFHLEPREFRGQIDLMVPPERIPEVCRALRDELGFDMLMGVSAVDYWPEQEPRFHVLYFLHDIKTGRRLTLRAPVSGSKPSLRTVVDIYPAANWYEREVWDMFGVRFIDHPDLRRIIMPADWEGHPLRKDYPLGYEEVRFTFTEEEMDARKPSPKD